MKKISSILLALKRAGCSVKDGKVTISLKGKLKNEPVALAFQTTKQL